MLRRCPPHRREVTRDAGDLNLKTGVRQEGDLKYCSWPVRTRRFFLLLASRRARQTLTHSSKIEGEAMLLEAVEGTEGARSGNRKEGRRQQPTKTPEPRKLEKRRWHVSCAGATYGPLQQKKKMQEGDRRKVGKKRTPAHQVHVVDGRCALAAVVSSSTAPFADLRVVFVAAVVRSSAPEICHRIYRLFASGILVAVAAPPFPLPDLPPPCPRRPPPPWPRPPFQGVGCRGSRCMGVPRSEGKTCLHATFARRHSRQAMRNPP